MVIGTVQKKKSPGKTKMVMIEETTEMMPGEKRPEREETSKSPLDISMNQMEKTYTAYQEARQQVERAYHENEGLIAQACLRAEKKAHDTFDAGVSRSAKHREEALARTLQAREEAIRQAEEDFKNANGAVEKDNEEAMAQATRERQETLERIWKQRDENMEQAWNIYSRMTR